MVFELPLHMMNIRFTLSFSKCIWVFVPLVMLGCESPTSTSVYLGSKQIIVNRIEVPDSSTWPTGDYTVIKANITGDLLYLQVECATESPREINLVVWNYWLASNPIGVSAMVSFQPGSQGTPAQRYTIVYDLTPLKEAYRQEVHSPTEIIVVSLNWNGRTQSSVRYVF
jgi:hypothetical protein